MHAIHRKDTAPFGRSSEVVPLVDGDGAAYFAAVEAEVDRLAAGDVWWVTGWLCSPDFRFGPGGPTLGSLLATKAAAGVDIRVVLWASRTLLDHPSLGGAVAGPFLTVTRINVRAAETLRAAAVTGGAMPLAGRVLLDWSGNAASSHHMKLNVLSRDGAVTAFAGGLDYWPDRWDAPPHATRFTRPDGSTYTWGWHDAGVRVTGDAARAVLDTVATRWTEASTLSPATYDLGAGARPYNPPPPVPLVPPPPRPGPAPSPDTSVQVVRSFPDSKEFRLLGRNVRWTTLPADGVHEVRSTLRTAIAAARRYVHVEDQSFDAVDSLFPALADACRRGVKVIAVVPGTADPNDGAAGPANRTLSAAVSTGLLGRLTPAEQQNVAVWRLDNVTVHSKLVLADDEFLCIGRRDAGGRTGDHCR